MTQPLSIDPQRVIEVLKHKLNEALEESIMLTAAVNQLQDELVQANSDINDRDSEIASYKQKEAMAASGTPQEPQTPSSEA